MIQVDKLSKQNKNFGLKLFFSYIIFTIMIIVSITLIHVYFSDEQRIVKFEKKVQLQSSEKKSLFDNYFKTKEDALLAIAKNEYFLNFVDDGSYQYYIDLLFFTIMDANKDYMQMRFIDKKGLETLRFDREKVSKEPYKSNKMQNKMNRYYFKSASLLKPNKVWFSQIDLNIEHGNIEKPYKPVVRVATPIYINDSFKGILIINVFMEELFESLISSSLHDIYLVDLGGYYLKHKHKKYDWSIYSTKHNLEHDFEDNIVYKILSNYNTARVVDDNMFVQPLILGNQRMNMLLVEKDESIQEVEKNNNIMIVTILIFATFMSLIFTLIFTRSLKNVFEIVVQQGDKLHDLATNLDTKVALKTLENAKKDRLLQHQSKLAELGDMIGNIAHQWRHPLTRLSLTLQNVKAYKNKGKLSDKLLDDSLENSLYQIEFMSTTIDNFKDFYKKDKEKSSFLVKECIDNVLKIIGSVLEHSNVTLTITDDYDVEIYGNKNEFSQVIMNIIINAKDALDDNKVIDPKISIDIQQKGTQVRVILSDNAGGVSPSIIDDIFNPYFTTKDDKGTGIGLYLSRAIIEENMNGKLTVGNLSNGAEFVIELKA